jgi:ABC-type Fe3+-citrate transport system substrate-binding protein
MTEEQHIYHHSDSDGVRVNVKVERNSRGFNYEATITGAKTVDEAMGALKEAESKLRDSYGGGADVTEKP